MGRLKKIMIFDRAQKSAIMPILKGVLDVKNIVFLKLFVVSGWGTIDYMIGNRGWHLGLINFMSMVIHNIAVGVRLFTLMLINQAGGC